MNVRDLARTDDRWVPGSGPTPARLAFVGEAPGVMEVRARRAFVGPSGELNWQFAARYGGVQRAGAYVTNWRKIPFSDQEKKSISEEEIEQWGGLLREELEAVRPQVVVALGGWAVRGLLGSGYDLTWSNGLGFFDETCGWATVPIVHPAAGIHKSDLLQKTAEGYQGLARILAGGPTHVWATHAPETRRTYAPNGLQNVTPTEVAIDTEGSKRYPWCLTFAVNHQQAYFIRHDDQDGLRWFAWWLREHRPRVLLHNALHDLPVLRTLGVDILEMGLDFTDTMELAFALQTEPRGLKELAKRYLGLQMVEYETLVGPYQQAAEKKWRANVYARALEACTLVPQLTPKGKPRMSKGQPVHKWEGPVLELAVMRHYERDQQFSPGEEAWARTRVGPKPGMDLSLVPEEIAIDYAGRDAAATVGAYHVLAPKVEAAGLQRVVDLDHAALPLVDDMQRTGLHLDVERYWTVLGNISLEKEGALYAIRQIAEDPEFNPGSSQQVAAFCAKQASETGRLVLEKRTKSGAHFSTDSNVLALLSDQHPIIDPILQYRELDNYEGTYLLPLRGLIQGSGDDHRIFPNLRTTSVVSGRLSAHAPNVLAWPARTELGLTVRSIFTAPPGMKLVSWDLSQIELRIAAALSKDKVMTEAFLGGLDLHQNLASKVFRVAYEIVDKMKQRYPCKTVHYLMLYGGGGDKLFDEMRVMGVPVSRQWCFQLIDDTWRVYSGLADYDALSSEKARRLGYVETFLGRRRYLPGISLVGDRWPLKGLRLEAERQALNMECQGGAAELVKQAMDIVWREVYPACRAKKIHFRLWLQIHDELMGEVQADAWEEVNAMMQRAMSQVPGAEVLAPIPIEVSGQQGDHWGQLK